MVMNFGKKLITSFAILLTLVLIASGQALAQDDPEVVSASPSSAIQGSYDLDVEIIGSNFGRGAEVQFLEARKGDEYGPEAKGIFVKKVKVMGSSKLIVTIDVVDSPDSYVGDTDIAVFMTRSRKGKGTTLFKVEAKPGQGQGTFTSVWIEAEYYEFDETGTTEPIEYASPYVGPGHPWTWSGERQQFFGQYAYDFDTWYANDLDSIPRLCEVTDSGNPPSGGRYDCFDGAGSAEWNHGGLVSIPLKGIVWHDMTVAKNGRPKEEPGFCSLLNTMGINEEYLEFGATRYSILFSDGCPDAAGACPIKVFTLSYSGDTPAYGEVYLHPFHDLADLDPPLPDIGRMPLTGYVTSDPVMPAEKGELNVFTMDQDLLIGKFSISFYALTNGALVATCETDEYWDSNIRLRTTPVR